MYIGLYRCMQLGASVSEPHIRLFSNSSSVRVSVYPVWPIAHAHENNTCFLLCHTSLSIFCACSNDHMNGRETSGRRPRTRNPRCRNQRYRERARQRTLQQGASAVKKRARGKEATKDWVCHSSRLLVGSSLLLARKLILISWFLGLDKE